MLTTTQRLKRLKVGQHFDLNGVSYDDKQALYKTAYRLDIKITIRQTPHGVTLWRVK